MPDAQNPYLRALGKKSIQRDIPGFAEGNDELSQGWRHRPADQRVPRQDFYAFPDRRGGLCCGSPILLGDEPDGPLEIIERGSNRLSAPRSRAPRLAALGEPLQPGMHILCAVHVRPRLDGRVGGHGFAYELPYALFARNLAFQGIEHDGVRRATGLAGKPRYARLQALRQLQGGRIGHGVTIATPSADATPWLVGSQTARGCLRG